MPRLASPQARSANGLLGPTVSSSSCGPEPCTSTTAGNGPSTLGLVNLPGSWYFPFSSESGSSVNELSLAYVGGIQGGGACWCGRKPNPAILPLYFSATVASTTAF